MTISGRGWLIAVGAAILAGAVLFLAGRYQERGRAEAAHDALQAQVAALTQERDASRARLAAAEARGSLLTARSLLFETALDLEQRNFGTANERLDVVAAQLGSVREGGGTGDLAALQSEVSATDLRVAADLAVQRARILDFAARLDRLLSGGAADSVGG